MSRHCHRTTELYLATQRHAIVYTRPHKTSIHMLASCVSTIHKITTTKGKPAAHEFFARRNPRQPYDSPAIPMAPIQTPRLRILMEATYTTQNLIPTRYAGLRGTPCRYFLTMEAALDSIVVLITDRALRYPNLVQEVIAHGEDNNVISVTCWHAVENDGRAHWLVFGVGGYLKDETDVSRFANRLTKGHGD
jgi:hypothetical protein